MEDDRQMTYDKVYQILKANMCNRDFTKASWKYPKTSLPLIKGACVLFPVASF